jgi:Cft2 family RNA processing exonuclease
MSVFPLGTRSIMDWFSLQGGKVLIPAFALGRAQELLLILDEYWEAHPELQDIPIYYASPLAKKCMAVYQTYINAMNERIQKQFEVTPQTKLVILGPTLENSSLEFQIDRNWLKGMKGKMTSCTKGDDVNTMSIFKSIASLNYANSQRVTSCIIASSYLACKDLLLQVYSYCWQQDHYIR